MSRGRGCRPWLADLAVCVADLGPLPRKLGGGLPAAASSTMALGTVDCSSGRPRGLLERELALLTGWVDAVARISAVTVGS